MSAPGEQHQPGASSDGLLAVAANLSRYHREHEKYYSEVPLADAALRDDLASARTAPAYLYSAAELISHAAGLSAANSVITHDNERRWRIFHQRIEQISSAG